VGERGKRTGRGARDAIAAKRDPVLERLLAREAALMASLPADPADLTARDVTRFRRLVLDFHRERGRDLPWRHDTDPYRILVSEVMLQQTQVGRVAERYPRFLARFPDWRALASASLADVLDEWQGLGYNRRALQLKQAAEQVVAEHDGVLPADLAAIDALPGIGHATAAAILAYAFGEPVAYIETNVRAVMLHVFFRDAADVPDRAVMPVVERTLPRDDPRTWYWALMDYGTWLKKREVNPSRRSSHHVRQARFEGSMRQVRGAVLRALVARGSATQRELVTATGMPAERVAEALTALAAEGFAERTSGRWHVRG
jgi:A/G-specific adenine glycosylase